MNPALIAHTIGADTREAFQWLDDDDVLIVPTDLEFDVDDVDGDPVTIGTTTIDEDGTMRLHIPADDATPAGIYRYSVRAESTDWTYISAGILRVRNG